MLTTPSKPGVALYANRLANLGKEFDDIKQD